MPGVGKKKRLLRLSQRTRVGRSAAVNHLLATQEQHERKGLGSFLSRNVLPWIQSYLKFVFQPRHAFVDYRGQHKSGVYPVAPVNGGPVRFAIAGDWGSGTTEAETCTELMAQSAPDFTIHLGDVYYVGGNDEIRQNCLGQDTAEFEGVEWKHGARGSFALNGNHEMYANGGPYFEVFLKTLGMKGDAEGQHASFFCLELDQWRIVAIDTGYNSVGWPILSLVPGLNSIPVIGGDSHLEPALLDWLRTVVAPAKNPKATLLLSHHQYFSAYEQSYTKPAKQLQEIFGDQEMVWLWGHEHRLGIYERFRMDGGVTVYGRCIGHGAMPVEVKSPDLSKAPLLYLDPRTHLLDGEEVGENGYAMVSIEGPQLTIEYRDLRNTLLLTERFSPAAGGKLNYDLVDAGHTLVKPAR
jgi:hypothetical protein